jgi:hypothetical protein
MGVSTNPLDPPAGDRRPLGLSPAPPQHPGPGEAWRPLSGLCLSAFILALALALLSLISLWAGLLLPLALGIVALVTVDGTRYRGRALAWWAVGLSLVFGGWGLTSTRLISKRVDHLASGFVRALRSTLPEAERRKGIEAWLEPSATRDEVLTRILARWEQAQTRLGPVTGSAILPSLWAGQLPLMVPPGGTVAVDEPGNPSAMPAPGMVLWVRLPFERGEAHLALWVGDGTATGLTAAVEKLGGDGPAAVVRDARFFAKPDLARDPAAAPTPPTGR